MSLEKKYAIEFIGMSVLIALIVATCYFPLRMLTTVFAMNACFLFFVIVSLIFALTYFYIVHRLYSKIL